MHKAVHTTDYAEFTPDPSTWRTPRPAFNSQRFNHEIERRAGKIGSIPRFRLRWAGEVDDYILDTYDTLEGYIYVENGEEKFVSVRDGDFELPDGAVWAPMSETHKIFTPRWVIEEYNPDTFSYQKAWFVEEISTAIAEGEGGRIDHVSHYRAPAEIDIQMAEKLTYLRLGLNRDDIAHGLAELEKLRKRAEERKGAEFVDEIAQETAKAFTDGIEAKPIHFDYGKNFNIREHTNKKLQEFNDKI